MFGKADFAGMTINERLFAGDLLNEWDAAVRARDRDRMMSVLQKVDLGDQAAATPDAVLADPKRYGF